MTLNVYVDAFDLYYGCLMGTPYKWLNLRALCELAFPADQVKDIHYFTARIKPNPHDPDKHVRQDVYFRALRTVPGLHIHEGTYSRKAVKLPLHPMPAPPTPPTLVKVVKNEEKGSDVNLATRLLIDAFDKAFDAAVIITNDSDLAEPIRQVRRQFGYRVTILPSDVAFVEVEFAFRQRKGRCEYTVRCFVDLIVEEDTENARRACACPAKPCR